MCVWGCECEGKNFEHLSCQLIGAPAKYSPGCSNMPPGVLKTHISLRASFALLAVGPEGHNCKTKYLRASIARRKNYLILKIL